MSRYPSFYWLIDHRAPRYLPRSEPHIVQMSIAAITAGLFIPALVLAVVALSTFSLAASLLAVALGFAIYRWCQQLRRYVVRVPDRSTVRDFRIQEDVGRMQAIYADHLDLQPVLEPVLLASYVHARRGECEPIITRLRAMHQLIDEMDVVRIDPEIDNADLDELRGIVQIRRQMRREGLL